VRLKPPDRDQELVRRIERSSGTGWSEASLITRKGAAIGRVSIQDEAGQPTIVTVALGPTDPGPGSEAAALPGDWRIGVEVHGARVLRIDTWILRDDVPPGFRDNGRQSTLVDQAYRDRDDRGFPLNDDPEQPLSQIRRTGTLNALATGALPQTPATMQILETVGAYRGREPGAIRPSEYSATPDLLQAERIDSSAQADRSAVLPGIRAAGSRSATTAVLDGTSVSTPQVLRQRALGEGEWLRNMIDTGNNRLGAAILSPRQERGRR
jgi:hypothetical protein